MHPSTPRWPIAVIAVMIQLCLGAGYSWTVFRFPLESAYGWTYSSTAEPFRYLLLAYTFGMTFGGYLQDRFGPRKIATLGGLLVSAGCALGALYGSTPLGMSAGYATLCGLGMGFAYVPALAVLVKWFPDRRGMIVGLAVFGFGAGSMISAPVQTWLLGQDPHRFAVTLPKTFWVMSIAFLILVVGLSQFLRDPVASSTETEQSRTPDVHPSQIIRTWPFYSLWFILMSSTFIGLSALSEAAPYLRRLTTSDIGISVGLMGLCNGLGRLLSGALSDKIGRNTMIVVVFIMTALACGFLLPSPQSFAQGLAGMLIVAFAFGAGIACMPSSNADYFGTKFLGTNYGLMFTGFAISGFIGPKWVAQIIQKGPTEGYRFVFLSFVALSIAGGVVALALKYTKKKGI